jgi:hypothetical protein
MLLVNFNYLLARNEEVGDMVLGIDGVSRFDSS